MPPAPIAAPGWTEATLLVAHNGADPLPRSPPTRAEARARLVLAADRPIALYAGRVNEAKGLDQILALADASARSAVPAGRLRRQGAGRGRGGSARQRPDRALAGAGGPARLAGCGGRAALPASRAPLEQFRNCVLPLKLFAYLAAGRPILAPGSARHGRAAHATATMPCSSPPGQAGARGSSARPNPRRAELAARLSQRCLGKRGGADLGPARGEDRGLSRSPAQRSE